MKLEATDGPRNIIGIMLPERSAEMVCDALRGYEVGQGSACLQISVGRFWREVVKTCM